MTIGDVVNQLKYGELRSVVTKDDNFAITSYINLALYALYSKFPLKVSEQIIPLQSNIVEYTLASDLMVIESVYDENGDEFELDNTESIFSLHQIAFDTIQVPNPSDTSTLSVIYKATPQFLVYVDENSLAQSVPIPPQLLEPMLHYIGYRAHGSMDGDIKAENNTHYMRYVASCNLVESLGLIRRPNVQSLVVSLSEGISEIDATYELTDLNI